MIEKFKMKYNNMPVQVKASLWFLICSFLQKGISMLTTPIFTRLLTTEEYGQFNVFFSWNGIITIFVSLNLSYGVYTQGLIRYEDDRTVFSSSLQGLSTVLITSWTLTYCIFKEFFNDLFGLSTIQMVAMLLMIWTSAVFGFWASEQRVLYKYRMLVIISILVSLAKPILGIFLVTRYNDRVTARILGLLLVEVIGYTGMYIVQMYRGKVFFSKKYWLYALAFNIPLIPHYLSQTVLNNSDRIMISSMVGNSEAGIYGLAYSLANIMILFNNALSQTINPWLYKKIKERKIDEISPVAYFSLMIIASVNLLLILIAPEAVAIFAPKSYYEAIYIIPPVAMSVYFLYSYDLFAKFAFYYEKTKFIMLASVVGALTNIVLNYIFINIFGYKAAGYTTLVCYIIYCIGHYLFMNKVCDQCCDGVRPYSLKKIMGITIPFVVIGFLLLLTYNHIIVRYIIIVATLIICIINRKALTDIVKNVMDVKKK